MSNPYFCFKQFTVWHDKCAMRVNTDGVLLGAWATVDKPKLILDIGTGTGLIALMMAQRFDAEIHAIEIEENAYKQAKFNVANSPWSQRVQVYQDDFCNYFKTCPFKFDLIVSNPPYFNNSLKNQDPRKILARHNESLPLPLFVKGIGSILSENGVFAVILPAETSEFEAEAYINGLTCSRKMEVRTLPNRDIKRKLLEFRRTENLTDTTSEELNIYEKPGKYSYIYIELTKMFYLDSNS